MTTVQLRVKQRPSFNVSLDRVPVTGDYITPNGRDLIRVVAVVLSPGHPSLSAVVFATDDPDDKPDELLGASFELPS